MVDETPNNMNYLHSGMLASLLARVFANIFLEQLKYNSYNFTSLSVIKSANILLSNLSTDFAAALCDPIAYHQESEKRQEQLKSLQLDDEEAEEVGFSFGARTQ